MKKKVIQILSIALCMVLLSGSTVTANAAKKSSNTGAYQAVFDAEYYPTRIFRRRLDMMHRSCSIILYLLAFMREDQAALISMLQFTEPITRIFRQHLAMTLHPTVPIMRQTVQQREEMQRH